MTKLSDLTLIGILGNAGTGKDTIGAYLQDTYLEVYGESFANELKGACCHAFGIPYDSFCIPELKNEVHPYWGVSPRQIAQFVGTELFRTRIHELVPVQQSFWIKRLQGKLTGELVDFDEVAYEPGETVVISDVRFQNEYDWILNNGGYIIHLTRPGFTGNVGIANHPSEAGISNVHTTERNFYIDNNGTLQELYYKVEDIMNPILKRKDAFEL